MGVSHASFVGDRDGPLASLRFFTATGELPACGHGTIAALAFLAEHGGRDRLQVALLASERSFFGEANRAGRYVSAAFDPGAVDLREATPDERGLVVDALGSDPDILVPEICVASLARPRLLVPLTTPTALARLQPDYDRLRDGCDRLGLLGEARVSRVVDHTLGARPTRAPWLREFGSPVRVGGERAVAVLSSLRRRLRPFGREDVS